MLKETEGKAYQHDQAISDLLGTISKLPPTPSQPSAEPPQPFTYLPLANSAAQSVNGSIADSATSSRAQNVPDVESKSSDPKTADPQLMQRQGLFSQLHSQMSYLTTVLDEKNMVLSAANDTVCRSLARLDSSFPYIENEVSEEARLGSNTHWALPHMKEFRRMNGGGHSERSRRDFQVVGTLSAAATAIHEGEIAATRSEARREAMHAAKRNRAANFDSDADERILSRKPATSSKSRKAQDAPEVKGGSSTANTQANKRRRVEKANAQSEKAMSAALHGRLGVNRGSSRDTPLIEATKKRSKPAQAAPATKKK